MSLELNQVFENNRNWAQSKLDVDPNYFKEMAKGQQPPILYIGCSDSRVAAEQMMGAEPGQVFVHRNVANVVSNNDTNVLSVVNYAVTALKVKHAVVCGHTQCGGVKASMSHSNLGILNPYLRSIRDVYRLHAAKLNEIEDEDARYEELIKLNVQEQCINLAKLPEVQEALEKGQLQIHGWIFRIETGTIEDLNLDIAGLTKEINDIYSVY